MMACAHWYVRSLAVRAWFTATVTLCLLVGSAYRTGYSQDTGIDSPSGDDKPIELNYARTYVPQKWLAEVIKGSHVPMPRDRFEAIVGRLADLDLSNGALPLLVQEAHYEAELRGSQWVNGTARLRIAVPDPRTAEVELPSLRLPILNPRWTDIIERPARLIRDRAGRLALVTDGSRLLEFDWSLASQRIDTSGGPQLFEFDFADSVTRIIDLNVPADRVLSSDQARISPLDMVPTAANVLNGSDRRWYRVEPLRAGPLRISVATSDTQTIEATGEYRVARQYHLGPGIVEFRDRIELFADDRMPAQLTIPLPDAVQIQVVESNGRALDFVVSSSTEGSRRLIVSLPQFEDGPEPNGEGDGRLSISLTVVGLADWVEGATNPLPRLLPSDWIWSEESSLVTANERIVHEIVSLDEAGLGELASDDDGRSGRVIHHFARSSTIQCRSAAARSQIRVTKATVISAATGTLSGSARARIEVNSGNLHELYVRVAPGWSLTSLSAFPIGETSDDEERPVTVPINIVEQWSPVGQIGDRSRIHVRLNRAIRPGAPIRLEMRAVRSTFPQPIEALEQDDLRLMDIEHAVVDSDLLALVSDTPYRFRVARDDRTVALRPEDVGGFMDGLIPDRAVDLLCDLRASRSGLVVFVEVQAIAIVDTQIQVEAVLEPGRLIEEYLIQCDPRDAKIDQVFVEFSVARSEEVQWEIVGVDRPNAVRASRVDELEASNEGASVAEVWRVELAIPMETSFVIKAIRESPLRDNMSVSLASTQRALDQSGRVILRSALEYFPVRSTDGMAELPVPIDDRSTRGGLVGLFAYEPAEGGELDIDVAHADDVACPLWIVDQLNEFRVASDQILATVTCQIVNRGRTRLHVDLPPGARLGRVMIEGRNVPVVLSGPAGERLDIVIGGQPDAFLLELTYVMPCHLPRFAGVVQIGACRFDDPVIAEVDRVLLPADFRLGWPVVDPIDEQLSATDSVLARLVGPLLKSTWHDPPESYSMAVSLPGQSVPLRLYRWSGLRLAQLMLMAAAFVAGWMTTRRRVLPAMWLVSVMAMSLLAMPFPWTTCVSPLFVGLSLALLLRMAMIAIPPRLAAADAESNSHVGAAVTATIGALAVLWCWHFVGAAVQCDAGTSGHRVSQEPSVDGDDETPFEYAQVVIPTDDEFQPVGDLVYLPRDFYEAILLADRSSAETAGVARMTAVDYSVVMNWVEVGTRMRVSEIVARLTVASENRRARFELPFDLNELAFIQGRLTVDGRPPEGESLRDGRLVLEVDGAGEHVIEAAFVPRTGQGLTRDHVDIAVPRFPDATCSVAAPTDAPTVHFPIAYGAVDYDAVESTYRVDLGATDRLRLEWMVPTDAISVADSTPVERVFRMSVGRTNLTVEGAALFRSMRSDEVLRIDYQTDPNWRVVWDETTARVIVPCSPIEPGVLELLPTGQRGAFRVSFSMYRDGSSGIGRFRMPQLRMGNEVASRDWYAIDADDRIDVGLADSMFDKRSVSSEEFAQAWASVTGQTEAVEDPIVSFETAEAFAVEARLIPTVRTVREANQISIDLEQIEIRYRASLVSDDERPRPMYLSIPDGFQPTYVSWSDGSLSRPAEWELLGDRRLIVKVDALPDGVAQIDVAGIVPSRSEIAPPMIHATDPVAESMLELYRRSGVQVEITNVPEQWEESDGTRVAQLGRFLGRLENGVDIDSTSSIRLRTRPSADVLDWNLVTAVQRGEDGWFATLFVTATVPATQQSGLDACRLRVRDNWFGPFATDLDGQVTMVRSADQTSGVIVVRPTRPWQDRVEFSISAPLESPVRVPNVEPVAPPDAEIAQWVVLPARLDEEEFAWAVDGLDAASLRDVRSSAESDWPGALAYRVTRRRYEAVIRSVETLQSESVIRLLDQQFRVTSSGAFVAVAHADLIPSGRRTLAAKLPPKCELDRVVAGGIDRRPRQIDDDRWEFDLVSEDLPQRVSLVFRGQLPVRKDGSHQPGAIRGIEFPGVDVDRYLWSVQLPSDGANLSVADRDQLLDRDTAGQLRLTSITDTLTETMNSALELNALDRQFWFDHWSEPFVWELHRVTRTGDSSADADRGSSWWQDALRQQTEVARQLDLPDQFAESMSQVESPRLSMRDDHGKTVGDGPVLYLVTADPVITLVETDVRRRRTAQWVRWSLLSAILLGVAASLSRARRRQWVNASRRYAGLLMAAFALVWVIWLVPAQLGWFLLLASLFVCFRSIWNRRTD